MAVVGTLHKIVWGGTLAVTETWSCSVHFLSPTAGDLDTTLIKTAISQWMSRQTSRVNNTAMLDWIKVNAIVPTTGLYLDQANARTLFVVPAVSGLAVSAIPQFTLAVSTTTDAVRGYASKGRFFPPTGDLEANVGDDGRILPGMVTPLATSAAQLITDLNGSNDGECVVFSKVGQTTREILGVRVGRVVDTQQRRRKNLVEDYQPHLVS
jgi:hypothetical protein